MLLDKMALRIQELTREIEESAAKHNALVGGLMELKNIYHAAVQAGPDESAMQKVVDEAGASVERIVDPMLSIE